MNWQMKGVEDNDSRTHHCGEDKATNNGHVLWPENAGSNIWNENKISRHAVKEQNCPDGVESPGCGSAEFCHEGVREP